MKYEVTLKVIEYYNVHVDADNEEEAAEAAFDAWNNRELDEPYETEWETEDIEEDDEEELYD